MTCAGCLRGLRSLTHSLAVYGWAAGINQQLIPDHLELPALLHTALDVAYKL